jgi:hypothetical protein
MDAFSPELAPHWLAGQAFASDDWPTARGDVSLSQAEEEALEELADRVSAARSVY